MINQQTKYEITNALKALHDPNIKKRVDAIKRLEEIGIAHPQIIEQLISVTTSDPSSEVRSIAKDVLKKFQINSENPHQESLTKPQIGELTSGNIESILEILQRQNEILANIQSLLINSIEKENDKVHHFRSRIKDIDVPTASIFYLIIKFTFALIPLGIILFFILVVLNS